MFGRSKETAAPLDFGGTTYDLLGEGEDPDGKWLTAAGQQQLAFNRGLVDQPPQPEELPESE